MIYKVLGRLPEFIQKNLLADESDEGCDKGQVIRDLIDTCGTGRVMYRNSRKNLTGFPEREVHLEALEGDDFAAKIDWLHDFLKENPDEKVLLICQTKEMVDLISEVIQAMMQIDVSVFHEELSLLQRDRNAAYFADDEGSQLLLCSEIGSEGRNFQFAHHMVLFDLPTNPDLLEQRIGRLDRIGQTHTIHIHVPYLKGSDDEVLALWYHDGLNAFEENLGGATQIYGLCAEKLNVLEGQYDKKLLDELITFSKKIKSAIKEDLEAGYDKLLQQNTFHEEEIQDVITAIEKQDNDGVFEKFSLRLMDHFGLHVEDLGGRDFFVKPGHVITDAFPCVPEEGVSITFDRYTALSREDMQFFTLDHPISRACFDLLLASESGNSSYGVWNAPGEKAILIEAYYVIEALAPSHLNVDRFLPQTPVRVVVDHQQKDHSKNKALINLRLNDGNLRKLMAKPVMKEQLLPSMLDKAMELAEGQMKLLRTHVNKQIDKVLDPEIQRSKDLQLDGDKYADELQSHKEKVQDAINQSRLRLDSVRLIWKEN